MIKRLSICIAVLFFFASCEEQKTTLPGYSGNTGELIVVVNNNLWNAAIGEKIKEHFQTFQFGIPQPEPIFTLVNIPHRSFSSIFENHRNILIINLGDEYPSKVDVKKNVWANGQIVASINGKTEKAILDLIDEKAPQLIQAIENKEISRLTSRNKKFGETSIGDKVFAKQKLRFTTQKDAYIATNKNNFLWLRIERERPVGGYQHQISQGIITYHYPYTDTSQFNPKNLWLVQDSVTKKHLPGPSEGSYMAISTKLTPPEFNAVNFNNTYSVESRGLWRMQNDFMGGPYVSITTLDQKNNRIVTSIGYVYAPQFKKREYLREVEAIIRSISFE